jgi:hypothetical protein
MHLKSQCPCRRASTRPGSNGFSQTSRPGSCLWTVKLWLSHWSTETSTADCQLSAINLLSLASRLIPRQTMQVKDVM